MAVGRGRIFLLVRFFFFPDRNLFEQGVDHFALLDVADDFAALENDALTVAGGHSDVGLAGFTGTVDHAAQHADLDGRLSSRQALLQVVHDLFEVDGQSAASRTGDQLRRSHAPLRGLEDVEGRLNFHRLVRQQAYANRIANAVQENGRSEERRV